MFKWIVVGLATIIVVAVGAWWYERYRAQAHCSSNRSTGYCSNTSARCSTTSRTNTACTGATR